MISFPARMIVVPGNDDLVPRKDDGRSSQGRSSFFARMIAVLRKDDRRSRMIVVGARSDGQPKQRKMSMLNSSGVRIAISGTHCSGKTTLVADFIVAHRDYVHEPER